MDSKTAFYLNKYASEAPSSIALYDDQRRITYDSLLKNVDTITSTLSPLASTSEHIHLIETVSIIDSIKQIFATIVSGKIALPIHPKTPAHIKRAIIEQCTGWTHTHFSGVALLTSGSTSSIPKIALLDEEAIYAAAKASNERLPLSVNSTWGSALPIHHIGGLAIYFRCLQQGATVLQMTNPLPQHPQLRNCHYLSVVPNQLEELCLSDCTLPKLKGILVGGMACPEKVIHDALEHNYPVYLSYGMTEMGSQVCTTQSPITQVTHLSGPPLAHCSVKVSKSGRLKIKCHSQFKGYIVQGKLSTTTDSDGYFLTKDRGKIHPNGDIEILGRSDNMFIYKGENIQPEEIERALKSVPHIRDARVLPAEHGEDGHIPVAFITATLPINALTINDHLEGKIERFKFPRTYYPMPKSNGLKPRKSDLVKALATNRDHNSNTGTKPLV